MVRKAVRPLSAVMADFAAVDAKEARVRAFFEPITDKEREDLTLARPNTLTARKHRYADILEWQDDSSTILTVDLPPGQRAERQIALRSAGRARQRSSAFNITGTTGGGDVQQGHRRHHRHAFMHSAEGPLSMQGAAGQILDAVHASHARSHGAKGRDQHHGSSEAPSRGSLSPRDGVVPAGGVGNTGTTGAAALGAPGSAWRRPMSAPPSRLAGSGGMHSPRGESGSVYSISVRGSSPPHSPMTARGPSSTAGASSRYRGRARSASPGSTHARSHMGSHGSGANRDGHHGSALAATLADALTSIMGRPLQAVPKDTQPASSLLQAYSSAQTASVHDIKASALSALNTPIAQRAAVRAAAEKKEAEAVAAVEAAKMEAELAAWAARKQNSARGGRPLHGGHAAGHTGGHTSMHDGHTPMQGQVPSSSQMPSATSSPRPSMGVGFAPETEVHPAHAVHFAAQAGSAQRSGANAHAWEGSSAAALWHAAGLGDWKPDDYHHHLLRSHPFLTAGHAVLSPGEEDALLAAAIEAEADATALRRRLARPGGPLSPRNSGHSSHSHGPGVHTRVAAPGAGQHSYSDGDTSVSPRGPGVSGHSTGHTNKSVTAADLISPGGLDIGGQLMYLGHTGHSRPESRGRVHGRRRRTQRLSQDGSIGSERSAAGGASVSGDEHYTPRGRTAVHQWGSSAAASSRSSSPGAVGGRGGGRVPQLSRSAEFGPGTAHGWGTGTTLVGVQQGGPRHENIAAPKGCLRRPHSAGPLVGSGGGATPSHFNIPGYNIPAPVGDGDSSAAVAAADAAFLDLVSTFRGAAEADRGTGLLQETHPKSDKAEGGGISNTYQGVMSRGHRRPWSAAAADARAVLSEILTPAAAPQRAASQQQQQQAPAVSGSSVPSQGSSASRPQLPQLSLSDHMEGQGQGNSPGRHPPTSSGATAAAGQQASGRPLSSSSKGPLSGRPPSGRPSSATNPLSSSAPQAMSEEAQSQSPRPGTSDLKQYNGGQVKYTSSTSPPSASPARQRPWSAAAALDASTSGATGFSGVNGVSDGTAGAAGHLTMTALPLPLSDSESPPPAVHAVQSLHRMFGGSGASGTGNTTGGAVASQERQRPMSAGAAAAGGVSAAAGAAVWGGVPCNGVLTRDPAGFPVTTSKGLRQQAAISATQQYRLKYHSSTKDRLGSAGSTRGGAKSGGTRPWSAGSAASSSAQLLPLPQAAGKPESVVDNLHSQQGKLLPSRPASAGPLNGSGGPAGVQRSTQGSTAEGHTTHTLGPHTLGDTMGISPAQAQAQQQSKAPASLSVLGAEQLAAEQARRELGIIEDDEEEEEGEGNDGTLGGSGLESAGATGHYRRPVPGSGATRSSPAATLPVVPALQLGTVGGGGTRPMSGNTRPVSASSTRPASAGPSGRPPPGPSAVRPMSGQALQPGVAPASTAAAGTDSSAGGIVTTTNNSSGTAAVEDGTAGAVQQAPLSARSAASSITFGGGLLGAGSVSSSASVMSSHTHSLVNDANLTGAAAAASRTARRAGALAKARRDIWGLVSQASGLQLSPVGGLGASSSPVSPASSSFTTSSLLGLPNGAVGTSTGSGDSQTSPRLGSLGQGGSGTAALQQAVNSPQSTPRLPAQPMQAPPATGVTTTPSQPAADPQHSTAHQVPSSSTPSRDNSRPDSGSGSGLGPTTSNSRPPSGSGSGPSRGGIIGTAAAEAEARRTLAALRQLEAEVSAPWGSVSGHLSPSASHPQTPHLNLNSGPQQQRSEQYGGSAGFNDTEFDDERGGGGVAASRSHTPDYHGGDDEELEVLMREGGGGDCLDPELQEMLASSEVLLPVGSTTHSRPSGTGSNPTQKSAVQGQYRGTTGSGRLPGEGMWSSLAAPGEPLHSHGSGHSGARGHYSSAGDGRNASDSATRGLSLGHHPLQLGTTGGNDDNITSHSPATTTPGEELYPGSAASYYATHGPRRRDRPAPGARLAAAEAAASARGGGSSSKFSGLTPEDAAYYHLHAQVQHPAPSLDGWLFKVYLSDLGVPGSSCGLRTCIAEATPANAQRRLLVPYPPAKSHDDSDGDYNSGGDGGRGRKSEREPVLSETISPVDLLPWVEEPGALYRHWVRVEAYSILPTAAKVVDAFMFMGDGAHGGGASTASGRLGTAKHGKAAVQPPLQPDPNRMKIIEYSGTAPTWSGTTAPPGTAAGSTLKRTSSTLASRGSQHTSNTARPSLGPTPAADHQQSPAVSAAALDGRGSMRRQYSQGHTGQHPSLSGSGAQQMPQRMTSLAHSGTSSSASGVRASRPGSLGVDSNNIANGDIEVVDAPLRVSSTTLHDMLRGSMTTSKGKRSMSASASSLLKRGGSSSGHLNRGSSSGVLKGGSSGTLKGGRGWSESLSAATLEVAKARVKEVERMTKMPGAAVQVRSPAGSTSGPRAVQEGGQAGLTVQELAALQQAGIRLI